MQTPIIQDAPVDLHSMTQEQKLEDIDPLETRDWIESIDSVLKALVVELQSGSS